MPSLAYEPKWYALRTRSRHEKSVSERLTGKGIEPLLPTVLRVSQWKDRKKEIEVPLFAGYCFAKFSWRERLPVLQLPGVAGVVGAGDRPEPVPEEEIQALRTLMQTSLRYDAHPYLREGMKVEVVDGPLMGVSGVLVRKLSGCRLVIAVHLIQRAVAVEIDEGHVVALQ